MKFHPGASYLEESAWRRVETFLSPYESALQLVAKPLGFKVRSDRRWPGLILNKRGLKKQGSYRLMLNSNYLEDSVLEFQLVWESPELSRAGTKPGNIKPTTLRTYTLDQFKNVDEVVVDIASRIA